MKLTLKDLDQNGPSYLKLLQAELPMLVSWRIKEFAKIMTEALRDLTEDRNKLIKKYGVKDDKGLRLDPKKADEFQEEWEGVLTHELEFPNIKVTLKEAEPAKLTAFDMGLIGDILTNEGSTEPAGPDK